MSSAVMKKEARSEASWKLSAPGEKHGPEHAVERCGDSCEQDVGNRSSKGDKHLVAFRVLEIAKVYRDGLGVGEDRSTREHEQKR